MVKPTQSGPGRPKRSSDIPLTGSRRLDRNSDVPLYFQLAAALKVMLEVEDWESGARFASEREIEEEFSVSRAVIRPALDLLVGDGAIYRIKGSGAFGAPPRQEIVGAGLVRLGVEEQRNDRRVAVQAAREILPDPTVSHFLALEDEGKPIAHVTAVVDVGEPSVCLVDSYSTIAHVPWFLATAEALKAGEKPPAPNELELTRATVSIEHTFFAEWGSSRA